MNECILRACRRGAVRQLSVLLSLALLFFVPSFHQLSANACLRATHNPIMGLAEFVSTARLDGPVKLLPLPIARRLSLLLTPSQRHHRRSDSLRPPLQPRRSHSVSPPLFIHSSPPELLLLLLALHQVRRPRPRVGLLRAVERAQRGGAVDEHGDVELLREVGLRSGR